MIGVYRASNISVRTVCESKKRKTIFTIFVRNSVFAMHCDPFIERLFISNKKIRSCQKSKNYNPQQTARQLNKTKRKSNKVTRMTVYKQGNPIRSISKSISGYMAWSASIIFLLLLVPWLNVILFINIYKDHRLWFILYIRIQTCL